VVQLVTLTFKTHQIENMVDFYTALGAELVAKPVKGSATHSYQGRLGGLNIAFYPEQGTPSSPVPRFIMHLQVTSLAEIMQKIEANGLGHIVMNQEELPHGRVSFLLDPDGHSIELVQPWLET
jgi:predicted enzyme related to lactoylglutathione lyase